MIKASETKKIAEAVASTPYTFLRLSDPKGNVKINGSRTQNREEWLSSKLNNYLAGPATAAYYCLYGKEAAGKYQLICEIETDKANQAPVISAKPMNNKAEANFELLQENAKLTSKVEILEFQNRDLLAQIADLEGQIEDLEKTVEELQAEDVPNLSENQNLLVEFAKPLLPGLQAFAFNYLSQFLPQNPNLPNNEPTGETSN